MSCRTALVDAGVLRDPASGAMIALDTPGWYAWLVAAQHTSFHFKHADGEFTARKERKQRGQWYWVAYRQAHKKLHKIYLGKAEALTAARLCAAAAELACACRVVANP
jgi:LuxR family maltose regulon positive regulatory protein